MAKAKRISQEEQNLWLINYLHKYVQIELVNKYFNDHQHVQYEYIGTDQRRIPTIIAFLKDIKLIKNALEPNHEWIQNYLNQGEYNKCPDFKERLYQSKYGYSSRTSKTLIENKRQAFKSIEYFKAKELIYVFNNQDQFIFKISGSKLLVISKEVYNNIDELVLMGYAEKEIDEDPNMILSYAFGIRFKTLNHSTDYLLTTIDLEHLTQEKLSDNIPELNDKMERLKRRIKENKILHRYTERFGSDKFRTKIILSSFDYIKSMAPVWVNSGNRRKIKIAKIVLEGLPEEE